MEYQQLNELLSVDMETRVHDAASRLIHQIAFAETRKALSGLREAGVIGEELAAKLALELNEALIRPIRSGDSQPAVEAAPPPAPVEATQERPSPPPAPRPQSIGKRRRKKPAQDVIRLCPICEEQGIQTRISLGSEACRAHWREVKRRKKARGG